MSRFDGWEKPAVAIKDSAGLFAEFDELHQARLEADEKISAWAARLSGSWLAEDMVWHSAAAGREMRTPRGGRIVRELIALGQTDPETRRLFVEGYLQPRRSAAKQVLQRGIEQGELRADINLDVAVDALYGPLFHRMLTGHAALSDTFVRDLVNLVLGSASKPTRATKGPTVVGRSAAEEFVDRCGNHRCTAPLTRDWASP